MKLNSAHINRWIIAFPVQRCSAKVLNFKVVPGNLPYSHWHAISEGITLQFIRYTSALFIVMYSSLQHRGNMLRMLAVWQREGFLSGQFGTPSQVFHSLKASKFKDCWPEAEISISGRNSAVIPKKKNPTNCLRRPRKLSSVWRNVKMSLLLPKNSFKNTVNKTFPLQGHREQKVEHVLWDQTVSSYESNSEAFFCRYSLHLRKADSNASGGICLSSGVI